MKTIIELGGKGISLVNGKLGFDWVSPQGISLA